MGRSKPLVRLGDKPLLAHTLDALRASSVGDIIVVLGSEAGRIRRGVPLEGTRVVVNEDHADGMSSSVRAGLMVAVPASRAFLIVLGDQPLVTTKTIDALVERHHAVQARVVIPTFRGTRGNPVLLDRSLAPEMATVRGDVGCRGVVAAHAAEVVEVPVDDPGILIDVDTVQDLRVLEAALRERTPLDRLIRR